MKRTIIIILTVLLVMSSISVPVFAYEQDTISVNEVIRMACATFPEYEEQIRGENITSSSLARSSSSSELGAFIIEETRLTDSGELMTYQQDESGIVVVTFSYGSSIVSSSYGTGYAYRKCNLVMYCNISNELLQVNNFEYTFVQNGYDTISSYGTTSESTATIRYVIGNTQETSAMKAFVRYYVSFTPNNLGLSLGLNGEVNAYLQATVGGDSCVYSANNGLNDSFLFNLRTAQFL